MENTKELQLPCCDKTRLADELRHKGYKVFNTNNQDVRIINEIKPDIILTIPGKE